MSVSRKPLTLVLQSAFFGQKISSRLWGCVTQGSTLCREIPAGIRPQGITDTLNRSLHLVHHPGFPRHPKYPVYPSRHKDTDNNPNQFQNRRLCSGLTARPFVPRIRGKIQKSFLFPLCYAAQYSYEGRSNKSARTKSRQVEGMLLFY